MTHIITDSGFECDIDEDVVNDMEFFEALCALDDGDVIKLPKTVKMLLGEEQKKKLYEHLRAENGRVPIDAFAKEIENIFTKLQTKKN